jgi:hypothetical protein
LPSYLSVRQHKAAGTRGKDGWRRAKTAGEGLGESPEGRLRNGLRAAACLKGGEPWQTNKTRSRTRCWLRRSDRGKLMDTRFGAPSRSLQLASRRFSRLCVLINPVLPEAIHRDHAGEMLENPTLVARNNLEIAPDIYKSQTCWTTSLTCWIEMRQLTNRRMRTFIATPSARNVNSTEDPP